MKIRLIKFDDFYQKPVRAHYNDAGADVYAPRNVSIQKGAVKKIGLGFGVEIPDGFTGFIFPRSGLAAKGIVCELPPIDSGYRGEVHAVISNHSGEFYQVKKGERIGQLVIVPCVLAEFCETLGDVRGVGSFGSTGN